MRISIRILVWSMAGAGMVSWVQADQGQPMGMHASSMLLAAKEADPPLSKEDLFGLDEKPSKDKDAKAGLPAMPASKDELFELDPKPAKPAKSEPPLSKDDLFGLDADTNKNKKDTKPVAQDLEAPASKDALFGLEPKPDEKTAPPSADKAGASIQAQQTKPTVDKAATWSGTAWGELAYNYQEPAHWSKVKGRLEFTGRGDWGQGVKWKAGARLNYNAIYDLSDFYPRDVRNDQRAELDIREVYLDFAGGGWDWRIGRQDVVWGEMVGLFFADVVSAKDLREFVLPDFQVLRIPQWAARAEYFNDDFHAEVVWIPFPSYDNSGKPGSDYFSYPVSPAGIPVVLKERFPGNSLDHGNFGVRLSQLTHGWDISGFYYSSMDASPTLVRDAVTQNIFTPVHKRIWQAGGTLAKDFGTFVLKGEAVYTHGRQFNVTNLVSSDGLVEQHTLDWALGFDMNPSGDTRFNTQIFQRVYFDHDPDTIFDSRENGFTVLLNHKLGRDWEAEVLWIRSLNRDDWLLRPKMSWRMQPNTRLNFGLDIFHGPPEGLFGQYSDRGDRVYMELRRDF